MRNTCLPCRLRKAYAVLWGSNPFFGSETPKHNAFNQFWKFEFHFEHFPINNQFLSLKDPLIICIYLRTTNRHFRNLRNVRHPTSNLLKSDLVETLNTFRNRFSRIFAAGKASLVLIVPAYYQLVFLCYYDYTSTARIQRCIQNPVKGLRWNLLRKYITIFSCYLLLRKAPSKIFDKRLNAPLEYAHFVYVV